mmetsp:Transcript_31448/g.27809  ORF Transcript_31448/g.27809 Transcript_31448/m.27809 type:complete len:162 (-) Transcript_31448:21-506(-)
MAKYNEDILLTGCDDGYVRAINLLPNKVVSIINDDADEEDAMPVSKISIKNNIVAFTCNDEMVRIYDIRNYEEQGEDIEEDSEVEGEGNEPAEANGGNEEMKHDSDADKDWEEIEAEMESDSEDDERINTNELVYTGQDINWVNSKTAMDKKRRQDFFSDL